MNWNASAGALGPQGIADHPGAWRRPGNRLTLHEVLSRSACRSVDCFPCSSTLNTWRRDVRSRTRNRRCRRCTGKLSRKSRRRIARERSSSAVSRWAAESRRILREIRGRRRTCVSGVSASSAGQAGSDARRASLRYRSADAFSERHAGYIRGTPVAGKGRGAPWEVARRWSGRRVAIIRLKVGKVGAHDAGSRGGYN